MLEVLVAHAEHEYALDKGYDRPCSACDAGKEDSEDAAPSLAKDKILHSEVAEKNCKEAAQEFLGGQFTAADASATLLEFNHEVRICIQRTPIDAIGADVGVLVDIVCKHLLHCHRAYCGPVNENLIHGHLVFCKVNEFDWICKKKMRPKSVEPLLSL